MGGWTVTPGTRRRAASALVVLLVAGPLFGVPARADDGRDPYSSSAVHRYQVTLAARSCDSYREITAGKVRDDTDEVVGRPGIDSPYQAGRAVDPDTEDEVD